MRRLVVRNGRMGNDLRIADWTDWDALMRHIDIMGYEFEWIEDTEVLWVEWDGDGEVYFNEVDDDDVETAIELETDGNIRNLLRVCMRYEEKQKER